MMWSYLVYNPDIFFLKETYTKVMYCLKVNLKVSVKQDVDILAIYHIS